MIHDVIIIGSGPAGLTAGIYLGRFGRKPLIVDGDQPGGQLMLTGAVENWPGELSIQGPDLIKKMREQAQKCGCSFLSDTIVKIQSSQELFTLTTKHNKTFQARTIIIATGSSPRRMGVPGEDEYWGKGVTSCATCDAPLYKDRDVVIVGGGNSAIAEGYALSKFAKHVTIVQIHDKLTANDPITDDVLAMPNVKVLYNKKITKVKGNGEHVTSVTLEDQSDDTVTDLPTAGLFVAIGMVPSAGPFRELVKIDEHGYIVKQDGQRTTVTGVFVAGDVADPVYRQAITASGTGCKAALECEKILK